MTKKIMNWKSSEETTQLKKRSTKQPLREDEGNKEVQSNRHPIQFPDKESNGEVMQIEILAVNLP